MMGIILDRFISRAPLCVLELTDPPAIRCLLCGSTSYHPKDIEHHYCGRCHLFLDVVRTARMMHADGATHECNEWPTALNACAVCGNSVIEQNPQ